MLESDLGAVKPHARLVIHVLKRIEPRNSADDIADQHMAGEAFDDREGQKGDQCPEGTFRKEQERGAVADVDPREEIRAQEFHCRDRGELRRFGNAMVESDDEKMPGGMGDEQEIGHKDPAITPH